MEGQGLGGDEAPIQYSVGMKQDRGTQTEDRGQRNRGTGEQENRGQRTEEQRNRKLIVMLCDCDM